MRRTKVIPVLLIAVMLVFAVLAYRTWTDERHDDQLDRISEPFTQSP